MTDDLHLEARDSDSLECLLNILQRIAQDYGPTVRTRHGAVCLCQLSQEPLHFVLLERHVYFDGGVAGDGGGDASTNRLHVQFLILPRKLLQQLVQHVFDLWTLDSRGRDLHGYTARAKGFRLETISGEFV